MPQVQTPTRLLWVLIPPSKCLSYPLPTPNSTSPGSGPDSTLLAPSPLLLPPDPLTDPILGHRFHAVGLPPGYIILKEAAGQPRVLQLWDEKGQSGPRPS